MRERDAKGRFVKGNPGNPQAKGRPKKKREERYYEIAVSAVPFSQWRDIIKKAAEKAARGDIAALRFLADYLLGRPTQTLDIKGLAKAEIRLEWDDGDDNDNAPIPPPAPTDDTPGKGQVQGGVSGEEIREDQARGD